MAYPRIEKAVRSWRLVKMTHAWMRIALISDSAEHTEALGLQTQVEISSGADL